MAPCAGLMGAGFAAWYSTRPEPPLCPHRVTSTRRKGWRKQRLSPHWISGLRSGVTWAAGLTQWWGVLATKFWLDFCGERTNVKPTNSYQVVVQHVQFPGLSQGEVRQVWANLWDNYIVQGQLMPGRVDGQEEGLASASASPEITICLMLLSVVYWIWSGHFHWVCWMQ